jgi:SAM-dependent methyltransferase
MNTPDPDIASWDQKARDWHIQVGSEGDLNRRVNSDPVLWRFIGDVRGLDVLDAGCGTGYLAIKLARAGARVSAVDYSPAMIEVARENAVAAGVSVRLETDSIAELRTCGDEAFDLIVSNYVLMDCADLDGTVTQFHRVLRPSARAALVFSHPCFETPDIPGDHPQGGPVYHWPTSYFEEKREAISWGRFSVPFIYYHRPLRRYWQAFREGGFEICDFDEPILRPPYPADMTPERIERSRSRPCSVAFLLRKSSACIQRRL